MRLRRADLSFSGLANGDPDTFAALYRRYERPLLAFFLRRTGEPELAADLTAETFAAVVAGCGRFDPSRGSAPGWLFEIAAHKLAAE